MQQEKHIIKIDEKEAESEGGSIGKISFSLGRLGSRQAHR